MKQQPKLRGSCSAQPVSFTSDAGQSLIEVSLSLLMFFLLIMGGIDFGYLISTKVTLQNAVRQAGRYAVTGQCIAGSNGACSQSRYNSIVQTLQTASLGILNSSNANDVSITCTNEGGGCPNNAGGPGDLIKISVSYPYAFITPLISPFFSHSAYTITVGGAFTNEPFPPGAS